MLSKKLKSIIALVLIVTITSCTQQDTKQPRTIKLGMVSFAGYAPFYIAKEQGFFGDLNVELKRIDSIPTIRAAMNSGDLDAYLATPDIAQDTDKKPIGVAIWAIDESNGGDGVVVSAGINDLKDLKGKTVAAEPGLPPYFILQYLLHKNGLSLNDVKFKDLTTIASGTAFETGAVAAAGLYEPFLSGANNSVEGSKIVISSQDTPGMIIDLIFTKQKTIETRSDDLITLIEGWNKAITYIQSNKDKSFTHMAGEFGLTVEEFSDIVAGINWLGVEENQSLFGENKDGPIYKAFNEVNSVLRRNRETTFKVKAEDIIDQSFLTKIK